MSKIRYEKDFVGADNQAIRVDAWEKINGDWTNIAYATVDTDGTVYQGGRDKEQQAVCLEKARKNRCTSKGHVPMSDGTF